MWYWPMCPAPTTPARIRGSAGGVTGSVSSSSAPSGSGGGARAMMPSLERLDERDELGHERCRPPAPRRGGNAAAGARPERYRMRNAACTARRAGRIDAGAAHADHVDGARGGGRAVSAITNGGTSWFTLEQPPT